MSGRMIDQGRSFRRTASVTRRRALQAAVGATGAVAAGLLAAACGGSGHAAPTGQTVNPVKVASAIAASVRHERHLEAAVTCPSGVPLRAHQTFYCAAEVRSRVTPFAVTQTDGRGHVRYVGVSPRRTRLLGTAVVARAIVGSLEASRGVKAIVRCPVGIPMQRGLPFACTVVTKSGDTHFEVRQTDDRGHVTFHAL
jgi:hypothetical protein